MNDATKYFEILGLRPQASLDSVKEAYRDLVKVWHPDVYAHNPKLQAKTQEKLKEINEAYSELQNFLTNSHNYHEAKQSGRADYSETENYTYEDKQQPPEPEEKRQSHDSGLNGDQTTGDFTHSQTHAGFWLRVGASTIDLVFLTSPFIIFDLIDSKLATLVSVFFIFVLIGWLYYACFEASNIQATPGKRAFGIIVTNSSGHKISFRKASARYFGKLLSGVIFCIGYIMVAFTGRKQALHDTMAETLVVSKTEFKPYILVITFLLAVELSLLLLLHE
jgi:uncharacterized RDD family membrane protein YckC